MDPCKHEKELEKLREDLETVKTELHAGDLKFQSLETSLNRHGVTLDTILKQTQSNAHVMFAIKWITIGVGGTLIAMKMGLMDFIVKLVMK